MKSNQISNLVCFTFFIAIFLNSFSIKGQKRCNSNQFMELQLKQHPDILTKKAAKDHLVVTKMQQLNQQKQKKQQAIVSIPVVFHVLYNNNNIEENVGFDQLESQIAVLNEDYRRNNADATNNWLQAADTQIEFCLANIDLNGNYFEGVTRTQTSKTVFSPDGFDMFSSSAGGKEIWPDYLNIYVCNIDLFTEGVLGIAPFPGYFSAYDGVVLDYRVVGRQKNQDYNLIQNYDLGRTATHEVGHWLDLEHIWGPGDGSCSTDDNITDTPNSTSAYNACNTGSSCGSTDMSENFMDYHFDACMNLFTQGQANKMAASINVYRPYLKSHNKCSSCLPSVSINVSLQGKDKTINSNNTITATNDIFNNANINYYAKNRISLNSGFSIDESCNFSARIVGNCDG